MPGLQSILKCFFRLVSSFKIIDLLLYFLFFLLCQLISLFQRPVVNNVMLFKDLSNIIQDRTEVSLIVVIIISII